MMTHEESYLTRLIDRLLLEPSAVTEIGLRKLHKEAADMLHLLSAAPQTAAVQPQEPVAWRFTHNHGHGRVAYTYHDNEPSNDYRTAYRDTCIEVTPLYAAPLARQEPKPDAVYPVQPSSEAARDVIRDLLARHATLIEEGNEHAYFELAYTRQTGWMAWITDRPARGEPGTAEYARSRKVVARGQGDTPDEACADAIFAMQQASTTVQVDGGTGDPSAVDQITDENRHGEAWPDAVRQELGNVQRHITDMLVAHRNMIDAQQRADSAAEVLAVQQMEAARSAVAASGVPVDAECPNCAPDRFCTRAKCNTPDGVPASDPDCFIGGAAGEATYAVAPVEAPSHMRSVPRALFIDLDSYLRHIESFGSDDQKRMAEAVRKTVEPHLAGVSEVCRRCGAIEANGESHGVPCIASGVKTVDGSRP